MRTVGTWANEGKLTATDTAAGDTFGWSVAVSGNTRAVIGASGDDHAGPFRVQRLHASRRGGPLRLSKAASDR